MPLEINSYGGYFYPYPSADDPLEASMAAHIHDAQITHYYDMVLDQHYIELATE